MILQGNSYRIPLQDNSVHCAISSFPYFGLRDYGLPKTVWGGRGDCQHVWQSQRYNPNPHGDNGLTNSGLLGGKSTQAQTRMGEIESAFCQLCGAWLGCFGLEPSIALHVQNAVAVCREIKRVLRPDGIFWLNYGDSYATSRNGRSAADTKAAGNDDRTFRDKPFSVNELPAKNLCGIPWRVALALQDDGWILRSDVIWSKRNPMPESVSDRPTKSHEYIFMLTKGPRYFYDATAVREAGQPESTERYKYAYGGKKAEELTNTGQRNDGFNQWRNPAGRNRRSVWELSTESYSAAHYATFPTKLVEPMVLASTSARGVCPECGRQWVRVTERGELIPGDGHIRPSNRIKIDESNLSGWSRPGGLGASQVPGAAYEKFTTGWRPTCKCGENLTPIPAVILDPFCGSGTVGQVARELGRRFIGIDLSAKYLQENALPRAEKLTSEKAVNQLPLFAALTI